MRPIFEFNSLIIQFTEKNNLLKSVFFCVCLFTLQFVAHACDVAPVPVPDIQLARTDAEPVLQLSVVQHDTAVPDVVVPEFEAVHVVPDGTHVYVLAAVPAVQTEEVLQ